MKQYEKIMDSGAELLVAVMSYHLPIISENLTNQIMMRWDFLLPDEKYLVSQGVVASDVLVAQFESDMLMAYAEITDSSNRDAISEIGNKTIKFADQIEFDPMTLANLPEDQRKRIIHQSQMFSEATVLDLQGATYVAVENNYLLTKEELKQAIDLSQSDYIDVVEKGAAAFTQSTNLVNDSRLDVFEKEGIQVYEFFNPNDERTTSLCFALNGTIFRADDPYFETYHAPLHWNCRSTYLPLGERPADFEIDGLPSPGSLPYEARKVLEEGF
jgi:SPP1 gp7 family putative phage head morphogenesis protein